VNVWGEAARQPAIVAIFVTGLAGVMLGALMAAIVRRLRNTAASWLGTLIDLTLCGAVFAPIALALAFAKRP
jgi:hypothetical protein